MYKVKQKNDIIGRGRKNLAKRYMNEAVAYDWVEEFRSIILEGKRRRPRINYIRQIIKNTKVDSYKQSKDKAYAKESLRDELSMS